MAGGIRLSSGVEAIAIRATASGLRVTHPRAGRLAAGLALLLGGAAVWACQLSANAWREPVEYALAALLLAPGAAVTLSALRARAVIEVRGGPADEISREPDAARGAQPDEMSSGPDAAGDGRLDERHPEPEALRAGLPTRAVGELVVRYGPAFVERTVARLPLDTLEVRTVDELTEAVRYDAHAVSRRLLAAVSPLSSAKLPKSEVKRHILQVRSRGQAEWLSVMGSQVASEVENARLALAAAVQRGRARTNTDEHG